MIREDDELPDAPDLLLYIFSPSQLDEEVALFLQLPSCKLPCCPWTMVRDSGTFDKRFLARSETCPFLALSMGCVTWLVAPVDPLPPLRANVVVDPHIGGFFDCCIDRDGFSGGLHPASWPSSPTLQVWAASRKLEIVVSGAWKVVQEPSSARELMLTKPWHPGFDETPQEMETGITAWSICMCLVCISSGSAE